MISSGRETSRVSAPSHSRTSWSKIPISGRPRGSFTKRLGIGPWKKERIAARETATSAESSRSSIACAAPRPRCSPGFETTIGSEPSSVQAESRGHAAFGRHWPSSGVVSAVRAPHRFPRARFHALVLSRQSHHDGAAASSTSGAGSPWPPSRDRRDLEARSVFSPGIGPYTSMSRAISPRSPKASSQATEDPPDTLTYSVTASGASPASRKCRPPGSRVLDTRTSGLSRLRVNGGASPKAEWRERTP